MGGVVPYWLSSCYVFSCALLVILWSSPQAIQFFFPRDIHIAPYVLRYFVWPTVALVFRRSVERRAGIRNHLKQGETHKPAGYGVAVTNDRSTFEQPEVWNSNPDRQACQWIRSQMSNFFFTRAKNSFPVGSRNISWQYSWKLIAYFRYL